MPRISALPALVGSVADTDIFPVVQGSLTKKVAFSVIKNAFTVGPNSITTAMLQDGSVTDNKLLSSPTNDAIRAVTTNHIRDGAITTGKIAIGAITGSLIPNGSIAVTKLVPNSLSITDFTPADAAKLSKTGQVRVGTTVVSSGYVKNIVVTNGGNYGSAPIVEITAPPPGGVQATATAVLTGTAVTSIIVTNPGSGYISTPAVSFNPGSASAHAYTIINGLISSQASGPNATLFLTTDEKVKVLGNSVSGQLGTGTASADDLTLPQEPNFDSSTTSVPTPVAIYAASGSSYVLCDDGTVWSTGENAAGQLGLGIPTTTDKTIFTRIPPSSFANKPIVKLAVATLGSTSGVGTSVLALSTDGTVFGWGANTYGQLGIPAAASVTLPQQVSGTGPSGTIIKDIVVGGAGTLVASALITATNQVLTAGYTRYGAMAQGPTPAPSSPYVQSTFLPWLQGPSTPVSNVSKVVITADTSRGPTIGALTSGGVVYVAGGGNRGQLGNGGTADTISGSGYANSPISSITDIACPPGHEPCFIAITAATPSTGGLRVWGYNNQGQLGIPVSNAVTSPTVSGPVGVNFTKVVLSSQSSLCTYALATDKRIFAAGNNANGRLGNATLTASLVASFNRVLLNRSDIVDIAITGVGATATAEVLTSDGKVYKCGNNAAGQLGRGTIVPAASRNWSNVLF